MSNKVDNGFELIYWNLSYRRKFIRTLWMMPLCVLVVGFMLWTGNSIFTNRILPIIVLAINIIQLIYNYIKWEK